MTYSPLTFEATSDIYKRTFITAQESYWTPNSRPIYQRLPGENQAYYKGLSNKNGFLLGAFVENAQIKLNKNGYIEVGPSTTTWDDGEIQLNLFIIGFDTELITWGPNETFFKGEVLSYNDELYTAQLDFTSNSNIEIDLEKGNLIKIGFPKKDDVYYLWLKLLTDLNAASLKVDIPDPDDFLDFITLEVSSEDKCNKVYHVFDNNTSTEWSPLGGINDEDWIKINFNGFIEANSFKLYSKYPNPPKAKLLYGTEPQSNPILISDFITPINGVYDFPINSSISANYLLIQFENNDIALSISNYSFVGKIRVNGNSSTRGLYIQPMLTTDLDYIDERSCVLAKIKLENNKVKSFEDLRIFSTEPIGAIADWLTVYWDELLLRTKTKVEKFIEDVMNPSTAGKFLYEEMLETDTYLRPL